MGSATCKGVAFRVAPSDWQSTVDYLRERELVTSVYLERTVRTRLVDGRDVRALTYVIDRAHSQYAGAVTVEEAARIVEGAVIEGSIQSPVDIRIDGILKGSLRTQGKREVTKALAATAA